MQVVLALGSNIEPRRAYLHAAREAIGQLPHAQFLKSASVYESLPFGDGAAGGAYLNTAVLIDTSLDLPSLLVHTQAIELAQGRLRHAGTPRWGARTLDIDIIWATQGIQLPHLHVPHPRLTERAFALLPLAELIPADTVLAGKPLAYWLKVVEKQAIQKHELS